MQFRCWVWGQSRDHCGGKNERRESYVSLKNSCRVSRAKGITERDGSWKCACDVCEQCSLFTSCFQLSLHFQPCVSNYGLKWDLKRDSEYRHEPQGIFFVQILYSKVFEYENTVILQASNWVPKYVAVSQMMCSTILLHASPIAMARLLWADRKVTLTQIIILYNHGEQRSIVEHATHYTSCLRLTRRTGDHIRIHSESYPGPYFPSVPTKASDSCSWLLLLPPDWLTG